jgi:hypothetical protein
MANKRMFDKAIVDTDKFMDMPMSAKALYFLLGMEADDEGFVSHKKVMRVHGGNEDDLKVLAVKEFIIIFQSGVTVITDWNRNNWLDSRRSKPTEYEKEKKLLSLTSNNKYVLSNGLTSIEESSIEEREVREEVRLPSSLTSKSDAVETDTTSLESYLETSGYTQVDYYEGEELGEVTGWKHPRRKKPYSQSEVEKLYRDAIRTPRETPVKAPRTRDKFNHDTWLISLKNSRQKADKVLALIWKEKGYFFDNYEQWDTQRKVDGVYARKLIGYTGDQILEAIRLCQEESQKAGYEWKASTVVKKIAEVTK